MWMMQKKTEKLYLQVMQHIREDIAARRPDYLDSERSLEEKLNMSRTTIRRACRELEREKLITPIHGKGYMVNYPGAPAGRIRGRFGLIGNPVIGEYETRVQNALIGYLYRSGLRPQVAVCDPCFEEPHEKIAAMLSECDGVFIGSGLGKIRKTGYLERNLHRLVGIPYQPSELGCAYVMPDLEEGFYGMTSHLIRMGHRRIALLASSPERLAGYRRAFRRHRRKIAPELMVPCGGFRHEGYRVMGELLASGKEFTAALCQNDPCALGVMERCFKEGIRVPEQLSIAGADNVLSSELYPIPLATVGIDIDKMCRNALELLMRSIRRETPAENRLLPPTLIFRESIKEL